jgi:hypothetical protein
MPVVQQPSNDSDEDEGLAEDGSITATLRLIPDDSNSRKLLITDLNCFSSQFDQWPYATVSFVES